jgi:hypothetical protein
MFAKRLFAYVNSAGDSALVGKNILEFRKQFFGLAFIPTGSDKVLGYNPLQTRSQLTMHYQTATEDSLTLSFYFLTYPYVGSNGFNTITTSRIGDLTGLAGPNIPYYPASTKRYIQDGSTVITELDLSDFYNFVDTLDNIIINSAEISVDVETPQPGMSPPSNLFGLLMKKTSDNKIVPLEMEDDADSLKWISYSRNFFTDLTSFVISSELSSESPLTLAYNKNDHRYIGYATLFFQELFNNKDKPELRVEHIGLYPNTSPLLKVIIAPLSGRPATVPLLKTGVGNEVNRAILNSSGIKLKLYYTKPNLPNLE